MDNKPSEQEAEQTVPAQQIHSDEQGKKEGGIPVIGWIFLSIFSSVFLILVNKSIMVRLGVPFAMSLTAAHMGFAAVAMRLAAVMGIVTPKSMPFNISLQTAATGVASIAFMNLSLMTNSVGSYQMFKLMVIPTVVCIETYQGTKQYSNKVKAVLVIIVGGVGLATVADASMNLVGFIFGVLGVLSTGQFQIWQGHRSRKYEMDPMQMVYSLSPMQFLIAGVVAVPTEWGDSKSAIVEGFTPETVMTILVSCVFAVLVNFSSFGLIGKTSAVTYQVVGHTKTCLILIGGFIFFPIPMDTIGMLKNLMGTVVALVGVVVYGHLNMKREPAELDWCDKFLPASVRELLAEPQAQAYLPVWCRGQEVNG